MITRRISTRLFRAFATDAQLPPFSTTLIPLVYRDQLLSEAPFLPGARSISLSHPKDPAQRSSGSLPPPNSQSPPPPLSPPSSSKAPDEPEDTLPPPLSSVPSTIPPPLSRHSSYSRPPFNTHAFVVALEQSFPSPTARSLMRATRALLDDRIERVGREGLTVKDLDNQAYLFRAALSELRQEVTTQIKNDTSSMATSTATIRREIDKLDVKMKEDVSNLKHEIQMDLDSWKNEGKEEFKRHDIHMEDMQSKFLVEVSDLRTLIEEIKWHNMRRAVLSLFSFVFATIIAMELRPKPPPAPKIVASPVPPPIHPSMTVPTTPVNQADGLEKLDWVT